MLGELAIDQAAYSVRLAGRVLELSRAELRHVIDQSAELGETIR